jgi:hypothetical protein
MIPELIGSCFVRKVQQALKRNTRILQEIVRRKIDHFVFIRNTSIGNNIFVGETILPLE